jgi:hypothetical protein
MTMILKSNYDSKNLNYWFFPQCPYLSTVHDLHISKTLWIISLLLELAHASVLKMNLVFFSGIISYFNFVSLEFSLPMFQKNSYTIF